MHHCADMYEEIEGVFLQITQFLFETFKICLERLVLWGCTCLQPGRSNSEFDKNMNKHDTHLVLACFGKVL